MESPPRRGQKAPNHVEMDARNDPLRDLPMPDEPGLRAGDLRQPKKTDRAARDHKTVSDRPAERASDFEERGASRSIVVRARGLVAEMSREDDLFRRLFRAADRDAQDIVGRGDHPRPNLRPEHDLLTIREARAEILRLSPREHEGETVAAA